MPPACAARLRRNFPGLAPPPPPFPPQLAYDNDPRIAAFKEKAAAEKAAAKQAKEAQLQAERDQKNAASKQQAEAQAAANAAAEVQRQAEAEDRAASKREKEKQRSALKKARKELKALGEGVWASHASDLDVIAAVLSTEQLTTVRATPSLRPRAQSTCPRP